MVMAADMSHRLGWIGEDVLERTRTLLERANLPVVPPEVRSATVQQPMQASCCCGTDVVCLAAHMFCERQRSPIALCSVVRLMIPLAQGMTAQQFLDTMAVDKKVQDGRLRLILLRGPLGNCVITGDFDPRKLHETLDHFM